MIYLRFILVVQVFIISSMFGRYNTEPISNSLVSNELNANIADHESKDKNDKVGELEYLNLDNEDSQDDQYYLDPETVYRQIEFLKRALPRMGRSYADSEEDEELLNEYSELLKRALPRMGRALPRMGRALPRMGRALPRMGRALPRMGRALPRMGRALPRMG